MPSWPCALRLSPPRWPRARRTARRTASRPARAAGRPGGMRWWWVLRLPRAQPRLEPRDLFLGRPAARGPEEVDGDDVHEAPFQPAEIGRDLTAAVGCLAQALRVRHDLAVVRVPSGPKQALDLGVGEAIHEVGLADGGLPPAGHDLPALPLEVFDRLVRPGEHVDRVLDRDRAETL